MLCQGTMYVYMYMGLIEFRQVASILKMRMRVYVSVTAAAAQ